ncbi:MAG: phenylalanine--tRNA ligase subunit beta [Candidatus Omnitrophica bacterium]|nr:phenylalanine--tRNA ligase subunit beta [Candidatus Omnitrophota bacterium]
MRVPLEWLKEYVPIRLSPEELADRLTMAGLEVIGLDEESAGQVVFDVEVTPNRPDCLSILGIAREVSAITGQRLKLPPVQGSRLKVQGRRPRTSNPEPRTPLTIRIEDHTGCQRYIGRLLRGVSVAPSPVWMQRRLRACGARPINNIVDITNYVLFEYGQPLHAFDAERLASSTVLVRRARPGERITTLDGVPRGLSTEMLIIADARAPVAIAGVMGGTGSEVTVRTTSVLLESALFDPVTIRRTARALGVASESSYRFERGIDPAGVETASRRAAALIQDLAGGEEAGVRDTGKKPAQPPAITIDVRRLSQWLGVRVDPPTIRTTLARLACRVASSGGSATFQVSPPSFRRDLVLEEDVYEELARGIGYDRIPPTLPRAPIATKSSGETTPHWRVQSLRWVCAGLGLAEAIPWALVSESSLKLCGYSVDQAVRLANPLSQDHAYVRPSLLIGLLHTVRRNVTQGRTDVRLFELGNVVLRSPVGSGLVEELQVGVILSGWWRRDWRGQHAPCDFWILKGLLEAIVDRWRAGTLSVDTARLPWASPGRGATVQLDEHPLGIAGQVSPAVTQALNIDQEVFFAQLSVPALLQAKRPTTTIKPPSVFPPVKRDLSVLIGQEVPFETLSRAIGELAGDHASRVELIDRFVGEQVPAGKKSLTFSIEYRNPSRTLTSAEVDVLHGQIGQALGTRFGAVLR